MEIKELKKCEICPRKCKVNRLEEKGFCNLGSEIKIALVSSHNFEEPCISGIGKNTKSSGTIFFSNCNLRCVFCQNYEISAKGKGKIITIERLAEIFLEQQERKVNNIKPNALSFLKVLSAKYIYKAYMHKNRYNNNST